MSPGPGKKHQRLSLKIAYQLDTQLEEKNVDCTTYQEIDWQVTENTVVRPDVVVSCGDHSSENKLESPPVMVFEILSPSTAKKDRSVKYRLYQDAGVRYYCIVDPNANWVEVFQLNGNVYREENKAQAGCMTFDLGPCTITIDFDKVLRG